MTKRLPWKRSAQTDKEQMSLPVGKTCGDCVHCERCVALFGHQPRNEVCDWAPSRFYDKATLEDVPAMRD